MNSIMDKEAQEPLNLQIKEMSYGNQNYDSSMTEGNGDNRMMGRQQTLH